MLATYTEGDEPVPGYRLVRLLGWGRFGEVWKAHAPGGFEAALKFISLSNKHGVKEYVAIRLFKQLRHPNLVPLTALWLKDKHGNFIDDDVVEATGNLQGQAAELVLAMGLGDKSLFDRLKECQDQLKQPGIAPAELLGYMEQVAAVLDFLHQPIHDLGQGAVAIQHCDIKPQNILVVGRAAQVCDLGVARVLEDVTSTAAMGSAAYIAPECISEGRPSFATDQYSLAVTYAELRTGVLPIRARSIAAAYMAHMDGKLDLSRLPYRELEVIQKATALRPTDRYPNLETMIAALRHAVQMGEKEGDSTVPAMDHPLKGHTDDEIDIDADASSDEPLTGVGPRTIVLHDPNREDLEDALWGARQSLVPIESDASAVALDSFPITAAAVADPEPSSADEPLAEEASGEHEAPAAAGLSTVVRARRRKWNKLLLGSTALGLGVLTCMVVGRFLLFPWDATGRLEPGDRTENENNDASTSGPSGSLPNIPRNADDCLASAKRQLQTGDLEGVVENCICVIAQDFANVTAWDLLARARFAMGNVVQALYNANRAIQCDPDRPEPYATRAKILAQEQQFGQASADIDRAICLSPHERRFHFSRTTILGQWSAARLGQWIEELSAQIERQPRDAHALAERGHAYLLQNSPERALDDCTAAIALDAFYAEAYAVRAEAYRQAKGASRLQHAIDDANTALRIDPECSFANYARALAYYDLGVKQNRQQILDDLNRATLLDPQMGNAFRKRAELLSVLGDWDRAQADWEEAKRLGAEIQN